MQDNVPTTPEPMADLLRLVGDLRRLAYDRSLDDGDRARRMRDRFGVYDGIIADDGE
jgi:hypothetical protein